MPTIVFPRSFSTLHLKIKVFLFEMLLYQNKACIIALSHLFQQPVEFARKQESSVVIMQPLIHGLGWFKLIILAAIIVEVP